jgi:hypothetical protein
MLTDPRPDASGRLSIHSKGRKAGSPVGARRSKLGAPGDRP